MHVVLVTVEGGTRQDDDVVCCQRGFVEIGEITVLATDQPFEAQQLGEVVAIAAVGGSGIVNDEHTTSISIAGRVMIWG